MEDDLVAALAQNGADPKPSRRLLALSKTLSCFSHHMDGPRTVSTPLLSFYDLP